MTHGVRTETALPQRGPHVLNRRLAGTNPFDSAAAYAHSSYARYVDEKLVRVLDGAPATAFAQDVHALFHRFVSDRDFSCLGAKAALHRGTYRLGAYTSLDDNAVTAGLARDLYAFVHERRCLNETFTTFIASFAQPVFEHERAFESALWGLLQRLHELDQVHHDWDPRVASNPADPRFSFSFARTGFFVVGLWPKSSRTARRFPYPTLVFNAHEQFDALRESGRFAGLQRQIRRREQQLDGSLNPNLAAYGERSESRQYSGRAVEDEWTCPFTVRQ